MGQSMNTDPYIVLGYEQILNAEVGKRILLKAVNLPPKTKTKEKSEDYL